MAEKIADAIIPHQIELAIGRLDSLATLPCVAARFFPKLLEGQLTSSALGEIIESEPALAVKIFVLMHKQALSLPDEVSSLSQAVDKLPAHLVRDALFSVKVYGTSQADKDSDKLLSRTELVRHCLAVACCAKDIAEIAPAKIDSRLCYLAGLLANIGNLALEEAMPKSFARIVEEAKSQNASIYTIQQKHLGTDYTIIGKRLAQRWHLPNEITLAIWLHKSNVNIISQSMPEARIAQIVQLADTIARRSGIGQSGSFDVPELSEQTAQSLSINSEQLESIGRSLAETVTQKSKVLGLDSPTPQTDYYQAMHAAVCKLAQNNTKLSLEKSMLQTASSHLDLLTEFLLGINSTSPPIEAAEKLALRWQQFYQTGMVCVYLAPLSNLASLEAVVVENLGRSKTVFLDVPANAEPIPQAIQKNFLILDADEHIGWLFEQLDADFNLSQTKIMPLLCNERAIGAIAFELRYPGDLELFRENFKTTTSIAAAILGMAIAWQKQQDYSEKFARLIAKPTEPADIKPEPVVDTKPKQIQPTTGTDSFLTALAEIASGAAHELNNPLSVVSGRAQMLNEIESDPEKKRMLKKIQENTNEISQIIEDLMIFAKPPQSRFAQTDIEQMLDEAVQLTAQKMNVEQPDVQIDLAQAGESVFVDSGQIVSAIANILSNSLESYTSGSGTVKVAVTGDESAEYVKISINDEGCGMNAETLQKATQPFFSDKPAGRKRGMGLAYAARLIQLNKGKLEITSQPGSGTTVSISLPRQETNHNSTH